MGAMILSDGALSQALTASMILAQADNTNLLVVVIVAIVVLLVIALSMASRKNVAQEDQAPPEEVVRPEVEEPTNRPTRDILASRAELDVADLEGIDESQLSLADLKRLRAARMGDNQTSRRKTALEATRESREAHQSLHGDEAAIVVDAPEVPSPEEDAPVSEPEVSTPERPDASQKIKDKLAQAPKAQPKPVETTRALSDGLAKTREGGFGSRFKALFQGDVISPDLLDDVEEFLFTADIGPKAASEIVTAIKKHLKTAEDRSPSAVWDFARGHVQKLLEQREAPLDVDAHHPCVILVVGVNGAGKTTTIGKLASQYKRQGKKVLVVAGDTFRAAAVDQLAVWADRADIPVHQGESEADPASVVYAGIERGVREQMDVIICDTSGRLHTNVNLMEELRKIERVSAKAMTGAPHETILVLDANMGQNAVQQAKTFGSALNLTGLVLTKLDGTARGGVILAVGMELDIPVRFIGIGEAIGDLRAFKAKDFADALFL